MGSPVKLHQVKAPPAMGKIKTYRNSTNKYNKD